MFLSMNKFYPNFKKSLYYIKLLAELDLLKDCNKSDDEGWLFLPLLPSSIVSVFHLSG